jgi:hypothetical protein
MLEQTSGVDLCGVNRKTWRVNFNLEIMLCGFPREKKDIWANLRNNGLAHLGYNIAYLIYFFYCFFNNFEPKLILVNINKLKPYRYVDQTLKGS